MLGGMNATFVSTGKAAAAIGVGHSTLHDWARSGYVTPAFRTPGGHFRWDVDDLLRQLRAKLPPIGDPVAEPATTPEPQPVVAAVVTSHLGVLITRRRDGRPLWGFPAGKLEQGESPQDAGVREVKEECGLRVAASGIIGRRVHPETQRTMIYMSAEPTHGTEVIVGDEIELAEVKWVSLAEAEDLMPSLFEPVRMYLARTLRGNGG